MQCSGYLRADVIPVPELVIPEKIKGAKPRNVVFILSDDHRYDAMSFMEPPFAKTPHMDELDGMMIPMNPPRGRQQNKRLRHRGGVQAADFPEAFIVDEPLRKEIR